MVKFEMFCVRRVLYINVFDLSRIALCYFMCNYYDLDSGCTVLSLISFVGPIIVHVYIWQLNIQRKQHTANDLPCATGNGYVFLDRNFGTQGIAHQDGNEAWEVCGIPRVSRIECRYRFWNMYVSWATLSNETANVYCRRNPLEWVFNKWKFPGTAGVVLWPEHMSSFYSIFVHINFAKTSKLYYSITHKKANRWNRDPLKIV